MDIREKISTKIQEMLQGLPEEFYCEQCGFLVTDEKTASLVEHHYGGYCDICQCKEPKLSKEIT